MYNVDQSEIPWTNIELSFMNDLHRSTWGQSLWMTSLIINQFLMWHRYGKVHTFFNLTVIFMYETGALKSDCLHHVHYIKSLYVTKFRSVLEISEFGNINEYGTKFGKCYWIRYITEFRDFQNWSDRTGVRITCCRTQSVVPYFIVYSKWLCTCHVLPDWNPLPRNMPIMDHW